MNVRAATAVTVDVPGLRIRSAMNLREHWATRNRRGNDEKLAVAVALLSLPQHVAESACVHAGPMVVTFTRLAPRELDTDNLAGGFKACRDQVAKWLGRDDSPRGGVDWRYAQEQAKDYGVRIHIEAISNA
jgi:hypothetical protein